MPKRVTTEPGRDRGPAILAPARFGGFPGAVRAPVPGNSLIKFLATTDHKQIGLLYLLTSFGFFVVAGLQAMVMRAELARPGMQFLSSEQYNQLFTSHGAVMLLLFATPAAFGFANYIVPIQIGAPDVSFPRLNALAYWLYLFGGLMVIGGFITRGVRRTSAGPRTARSAASSTAPAWARTCGCSAWSSPGSAPSSARST